MSKSPANSNQYSILGNTYNLIYTHTQTCTYITYSINIDAYVNAYMRAPAAPGQIKRPHTDINIHTLIHTGASCPRTIQSNSQHE
jgi:hypothetical protein